VSTPRLLFDRNIPDPLARYLTGFIVRRTQDEGWNALKNGELLDAAEQAGFFTIELASEVCVADQVERAPVPSELAQGSEARQCELHHGSASSHKNLDQVAREQALDSGRQLGLARVRPAALDTEHDAVVHAQVLTEVGEELAANQVALRGNEQRDRGAGRGETRGALRHEGQLTVRRTVAASQNA
jgi:hypothetical protein